MVGVSTRELNIMFPSGSGIFSLCVARYSLFKLLVPKPDRPVRVSYVRLGLAGGDTSTEGKPPLVGVVMEE